MSFAPASMRGACLNARLAGIGIQLAARPFGVITERGCWIFMMDFLHAAGEWPGPYQAGTVSGTTVRASLLTVVLRIHSGTSLLPKIVYIFRHLLKVVCASCGHDDGLPPLPGFSPRACGRFRCRVRIGDAGVHAPGVRHRDVRRLSRDGP